MTKKAKKAKKAAAKKEQSEKKQAAKAAAQVAVEEAKPGILSRIYGSVKGGIVVAYDAVRSGLSTVWGLFTNTGATVKSMWTSVYDGSVQVGEYIGGAIRRVLKSAFAVLAAGPVFIGHVVTDAMVYLWVATVGIAASIYYAAVDTWDFFKRAWDEGYNVFLTSDEKAEVAAASNGKGDVTLDPSQYEVKS